MRRPAWLALGVAIGVGGTLWTEQQVKKTLRQAKDRLAPDQLAADALAGVRQRLRAAVSAAREAREERAAELWRELDPPPANGRPGAVPPPPAVKAPQTNGLRGGGTTHR